VEKSRVTNRQYAESNQMFRQAAANVAGQLGKEFATFQAARQASKFRRGVGIVYKSLGK
jgi:hypothetical protein